MTDQSFTSIQAAVLDFRRARDRAILQDVLARLTGKSDDLLCYEDVRQKLKARGSIPKLLKEIPIDAIRDLSPSGLQSGVRFVGNRPERLE